jgi:hypothetical protein
MATACAQIASAIRVVQLHGANVDRVGLSPQAEAMVLREMAMPRSRLETLFGVEIAADDSLAPGVVEVHGFADDKPFRFRRLLDGANG